MKTLLLKFISSIATLLLLLSASNVYLITDAFADAPPTSSSNPYICQGGGADCLINGYGQNQIGWLVQPPYDQSVIMTGNTFLQNLVPYIATTQSNMLSQGIFNILTTYDPTQIMNNAVSGIISPLTAAISSPVTNTSSSTCLLPSLPGCSPAVPLTMQTASYNLDTLLNPISYQKVSADNNVSLDQDQNAQNFIQLVSGLTMPMPVVDFSKIPPAQLPALLQRNDVVNYLNALRTYAAQQGVGLSNLYHYYAERKPVPGLGISAGLPSETPGSMPPVNASPLQVEDYYANRRLNDPNWYSNLQNASPAAIQHEMLFLLAEIRSEMFKNRMEMERMTATLSAMQLQQGQSNRLLLQTSAGAVKDPLKPPPDLNSNSSDD